MSQYSIEDYDDHVYKIAFYYVIGILSAMPYYEEMPVMEIADRMLTRACDLIKNGTAYND